MDFLDRRISPAQSSVLYGWASHVCGVHATLNSACAEDAPCVFRQLGQVFIDSTVGHLATDEWQSVGVVVACPDPVSGGVYVDLICDVER